MNDDAVYHKVAKVLDTIPMAFPPTNSGVEIELLKRIFTPEEANMFSDLRLTPETAEEIAARTGRPLEGLEEFLDAMWAHGQVNRKHRQGMKAFSLVPYASGLYELQLNQLDDEYIKLHLKYIAEIGPKMFTHGPPRWQVVPIEKEIPVEHKALTYHQVSELIAQAKEFSVRECICKKLMGLKGKPCSKPIEVCLVLDSHPEIQGKKNRHSGRTITREEAWEILEKAEEAGLVHMVLNTEEEHHFICNCCLCCCGPIRGARLFGNEKIINSFYRAEIDPDLCTDCGVCKDERCPVQAIEERDGAYQVLTTKCIGCGLCATTCPAEAIRLVPKDDSEIRKPPKDLSEWYDARAKERGVDYSKYR